MMRELRAIDECIRRFDLDLRGRVVFTEAASGAFRWTPIIALRAGAARVIAIAKPSPFGAPEDLAHDCTQLARRIDAADRLDVVTDDRSITDADIITNLGMVRPISADMIARCKPTAVIPLMWETWEYRARDLDLAACLARDILVLGTDESHPDLAFMEYVGLTALKMLFDAEIPVRGSTIAVLGRGVFADVTERLLVRLGARVMLVAEPSSADAPTILRTADALIVAEHHAEAMLIGAGAALDAATVAALNPHLVVLHVSGLIDAAALRQAGVTVHPFRVAAAPRTMSITPAVLGARPVIELHTAGLRVGEAMARARAHYPDDIAAARALALTHPLCQDFSSAQYAQYTIPMQRGVA